MVFSVYAYEFYRLAEYAQRIEELDALTNRHVGISRAVQQQQRSVDLVGIEE